MISLLLDLLVPFHPRKDSIVRSPSKIEPAIQAVNEVAVELFNYRDSFGAASNKCIEYKGNLTKISYDVDDITPLFAERDNKAYFQFQFPDYTIGLVPEQFVLDYVRTNDEGYVILEKKTIPVRFSEPYLGVNGESFSWHHSGDVSLFHCRDKTIVYPAPVLLTQLRDLMGGDLDRFTFLTHILTQTPFNDMYKTIAAHIHERYNAVVLNGRSEGLHNMLENPRLRSYEIQITKNVCGTTYKVIAMIAGYFSACSIPPGIDLIVRSEDKEIGWYCCKIEYDLDARTAIARHKYIWGQ